MRHDALSIATCRCVLENPLMPTFISIKEAADLAGVSKKTVERAYKKHIDANNLTDTAAAKFVRFEQSGNRKQVFLSDTFVQDLFKTKKGTMPSSRSADDELINQLRVKDEQIKNQTDHISQLTERLKSSQESLQAEQSLHFQSQQTKRPLLSFSSGMRQRTPPNVTAQDRTRYNVSWRRVSLSALIPFSIFLLATLGWLARL